MAIGTKYDDFKMKRDISQPCDQRLSNLMGKTPLRPLYRPPKSGGHRHCGSGYIVVLLFNMISHYA